MRVLLAGWFSLAGGGATAGDLRARDVVCQWLVERGIPFDVAQPSKWGVGVDWLRVAPSRYSHLVLACGPVAPDLALQRVVERFPRARRLAVGVSLVGDAADEPFDVVLARDGAVPARPDLAFAASEPTQRPPVVARVEIHRQAEYDVVRPEVAHAAFDRLLAARPCAVFRGDTLLDTRVPGRRTAAEVEALLARADVILTTRLHGLVLGLRVGVPVLAIDPVVGGAKVTSQARVLGWPAVVRVEEADHATLDREFAWCLGAEARELAGAVVEKARRELREVRAALERALG